MARPPEGLGSLVHENKLKAPLALPKVENIIFL